MLIREKPYPIIRIGKNIYKFLPPNLIHTELDFLSIKEFLSVYNKKSKFNKLKIPKVKKFKLFTKTKYLGDTLFKSKKDILNLYKCISDFSILFNKGSFFTISLGDIQLRNVYKNKQGFYLLDLGQGAGKRVHFLYNQARFLVHLIDCNMVNTVLEILKRDSKRNYLVKAMNRRCLFVFKKRIFSGNIVSAIYRLFSYLKLLFKLYLI